MRRRSDASEFLTQDTSGGRSLFKEIVERRLHSRELGGVLRHVGACLGFEVIAEVCLILFAHFLRRGLFAVLGVRGVVLNAHLAHVQLGVTRLAYLEPTKRQSKLG